jgi:tRNA-binding EMAP/Myf-like protein
LGLPGPADGEQQEFKFSGLTWDPDKIVVAQIDEVMPHPNADRLVLCKLQDGQQEHIVLTGATEPVPLQGARRPGAAAQGRLCERRRPHL